MLFVGLRPGAKAVQEGMVVIVTTCYYTAVLVGASSIHVGNGPPALQQQLLVGSIFEASRAVWEMSSTRLTPLLA